MNLTANLQDYLKNIYVIKQGKGICRVKDLAELLKITPPSIIDALSSLKEKNLIVHEKYGLIDLTKPGLRIAKEIFKRHYAVEQFLHDVLGLDDVVAKADACKIEHYLDKRTIDRILEFVKFIGECSEKMPLCLTNFYDFTKDNKKRVCCFDDSASCIHYK